MPIGLHTKVVAALIMKKLRDFLESLSNFPVEFGNHEFILRVIDVFQRQLPTYLDGMEEAMQGDEFERLGFLAHKMKSSANMLGIRQLADVLRSIEEEAASRRSTTKLADHVNRACLVATAANQELDVARDAYVTGG